MLLEGILRPVWLDLLHMGVGIFDIAILDNQVRGRLLADARNARDIVSRIAHQGFQLDNLKRSHLILVDDVLGIIILRLGHAALCLRQTNADVFGGQLQEIPVTGQHGHFHAPRLAPSGHGSQQIVCLQSRLFHGLNAHGVQHILQHRHLLMKLRGHGLSCPFVGVVHLVPESRRFHIESHRQIIGLFLLQHFK